MDGWCHSVAAMRNKTGYEINFYDFNAAIYGNLINLYDKFIFNT